MFCFVKTESLTLALDGLKLTMKSIQADFQLRSEFYKKYFFEGITNLEKKIYLRLNFFPIYLGLIENYRYWPLELGVNYVSYSTPITTDIEQFHFAT